MISKEEFINDLKSFLNITGEVSTDTDLLDIDEWDSFSAVAFIAMAEEKYAVKLEPFSIAEAVILEDLYNIVADRIARGEKDA